ncbi:hypothetical protein K440DRAFT_643333 [Wilcoxina mikolae CBS 423.85]|nr:hypothetical protein K440DRAFT_643333 [Wilcoxina mikolae CBS 423.85]
MSCPAASPPSSPPSSRPSSPSFTFSPPSSPQRHFHSSNSGSSEILPRISENPSSPPTSKGPQPTLQMSLKTPKTKAIPALERLKAHGIVVRAEREGINMQMRWLRERMNGLEVVEKMGKEEEKGKVNLRARFVLDEGEGGCDG